MALIFQTPITTQEGITIQNAYGRVEATDVYNGTQVHASVSVFVSEAAFVNNSIAFGVPFQAGATIEYNREQDGTDILLIAHNGLAEALAYQGYTVTVLLD